MKNTVKIVLNIILQMIIIIGMVNSVQAANKTIIKKDNVSVAVSSCDLEEPFSEYSTIDDYNTISLEYDKGRIKLWGEILDEETYEYQFLLNLYPSQLKYMSNKALVGKTDPNEMWRVVSFRIEENASEITLLKSNLNLKGNILLSYVLENMQNGKMYYFQTSINEFDFESIYNETAVCYKENENISNAELITLEENYLTLNNERNERGISNKTEVSEDSIETQENSSLSINKFSTRSVLYPIPDSIFKNGIMDKMTVVNATENGAAYTYAYYQTKTAGTENRITQVVLLDRPYYSDFNNQMFMYTCSVISNATVLYNAYSGEISVRDHDAKRITVSNLNIAVSNTYADRGVMIRGRYDVCSQRSIMQNIIQVGLAAIPKVGTIAECFRILTTKADTKCGYEYQYQDTYDKQMTVYGKVVYGIVTESQSLKYIEDSASVTLWGNNIQNCTYKYSATFTYK